MRRSQMTIRRRIAVVSAVALGIGTAAIGAGPSSALAGGPTTITGTLHDGATYLIQVPASWNGTLVLYSHGYVNSGEPEPRDRRRRSPDRRVAPQQRLRPRRILVCHDRLGAPAGDTRPARDAEHLRPARRRAGSDDRLGALTRRDDHRRARPGRSAAVHRGAADVRRPRRGRGHVEPGPRTWRSPYNSSSDPPRVSRWSTSPAPAPTSGSPRPC